MTDRTYPLSTYVAAWGVHLYTISGGLFALYGLFEVLKGNVETGFILIIISQLIDGTDGLLARAVKVWDVLPNFDGVLIDHLIDIFSYVWLPVIVMWHYALLPYEALLSVPIVAALYGWGVSTKTDDKFFQGFPSLWGVVLIYLYYLRPDGWIAGGVIITLGILTFVPFKYLYPSSNKFLRWPSWILSLIWVAIWIYILVEAPENKDLVYFTLFYPIYYFAASFYATYKFGMGKIAL